MTAYPRFSRAATFVLLTIVAAAVGFAIGVRTFGREFDLRPQRIEIRPDVRPCECRCFVDVPDSPPCPRPW